MSHAVQQLLEISEARCKKPKAGAGLGEAPRRRATNHRCRSAWIERSAGGLGEALDRDRRWMEDESLERELDPAAFNLPGKKAKSAVITHMERSLTRLYRYRLDVDYKVRSVETELSESEKRTFCIRAARAGLTVRAYEIEQSIGAIAGRLRDYVMHVCVWLDADEVDRSAGGLGVHTWIEIELDPNAIDRSAGGLDESIWQLLLTS